MHLADHNVMERVNTFIILLLQILSSLPINEKNSMKTYLLQVGHTQSGAFEQCPSAIDIIVHSLIQLCHDY